MIGATAIVPTSRRDPTSGSLGQPPHFKRLERKRCGSYRAAHEESPEHHSRRNHYVLPLRNNTTAGNAHCHDVWFRCVGVLFDGSGSIRVPPMFGSGLGMPAVGSAQAGAQSIRVAQWTRPGAAAVHAPQDL